MSWRFRDVHPAVRVGAGVLVLLVAPLGIIGITQSTPTPEGEAIEKQSSELAQAQEQRASSVERLIDEGNILAASAEITNSITGNFPPGAYSRFLDTLQRELKAEPTRDSLELYGQVLGKVARSGEPSNDFQFHMRRMRHTALVSGGRDLLAEVGDPTYGYERLADYYRNTGAGLMPQLELVSYFLLYEQYARALSVLLDALDHHDMQDATDDEWLATGRLLARIAGASNEPAARRAMEEFARSLESYRTHSLNAEEVRDWMDGVARMYADESRRARGSRQIEKAVKRTELALDQQVYRLDLARALRDEAHRREAVLRDEYLPSERSRGRQYFVIGFGAARLGHLEELRLAIQRLGEDSGDRQGKAYLRILRGLGDIAAGLTEQGEQRIQDMLDQHPELLTAEETALLEATIASGEIPPAREPGRVLFAMGKLWIDLEQRPFIEQALVRLRRELSSADDLIYLHYLEALVRFRDGNVDGLREQLYALLDQRLPPDLSRGEVAALMVLTEEREGELARIRERRARALEILAALRPVEKVAEGAMARVVEWQVRMDQTRGQHVLTRDGNAELVQLEKRLESDWLEYPLQETWLELQDELMQRTVRLRQDGQLEAAHETLERCRELVKSPNRFRGEEGRILAAKAERLPFGEQQAARELWRRAGDAFMAVASSSFGDKELFFDATEAYMAAGDFQRALRASDQYAPTSHHGAVAEARYWRSVVNRVRIDRELGGPKAALDRVEENIRRHESGVHRFELLLERGLCREMLKDEDLALRDYDSVYRELDPTSESWQAALYRRAVILQRRVELREAGSDGAAPEQGVMDREQRVAARNAWLELAAWLPEDAGDVRLGEALYRSGEAWIEDRDFGRARAQFQRLLTIAAHLREHAGASYDRARWQRFEERALFSHADAYYLEQQLRAAESEYRKAVAKHRNSRWVPYGYLQLGTCQLQDGRRAEAVRTFQIGLRKTGELPDSAFEDSPKRREFWVETFEEKIRVHDR